MAAPIPEHKHSFDGSGISKAPDRDHRIHQGVPDNSLIKLKENDFSSLLLRQLPEPVPARQTAVRAMEAVQTAESSAHNHSHQRPAASATDGHVSSQNDRQDRHSAKPDASDRSGDDLPLTKDNQRQQAVSGKQDIEENLPAEKNGVVSEGSAADAEEAGPEVVADLPAEQSPDDAADQTEPADSAGVLQADGAQTSEEVVNQPAAVGVVNQSSVDDGAEQEKTAKHARAANTMTSHPLNNPTLAAPAEGEGEGGPEASLFGFSRIAANAVTGAGTDSAGQQEAEVTREFKELGKSLAVNQLAPAGSAIVVGSPQAERSELQRLALLESGLKDKVAVTPSQTVMMRNTPAASASASAYVTNIPTQVQTPEWQQGVVKKLLWFVSEKIQNAKIHVNPPELGPVDLKIQVTRDQAQVQVQSPHAVVRDLLEGTAIRLREMLANQGIELTNFNVGSQGEQSKQDGGSQSHSQAAENGSDSRLEPETHVSVQSQGADQIVDYYV